MVYVCVCVCVCVCVMEYYSVIKRNGIVLFGDVDGRRVCHNRVK